VLALDDRVGEIGGGVGLGLLDRLVDGQVLLAGDDALDAGQLGVLARGGNRRGSTPLAFMAAIAPPAVPSLAA
jgi:hypothetical protein